MGMKWIIRVRNLLASTILITYNIHIIQTRNRLQCLFEIDQFISFSLELMIGTLMASNIEDGGKY